MKFSLERHADKRTSTNLKLSAMKRFVWIALLSAIVSGAYGQRTIDELFRKYADADGFVTVTLNGSLLKFAKALDDDKDLDHKGITGDINEIRILAQEDKSLKTDNFYNFVIRDINLSDYDEFLRVKEKGQDLRMLVKTEGDHFREFLVIGGGEDNLVIQIKGNLSLHDAENLSSDLKRDHGRRSLVTDLD
jgi:hypothetical protein